MTHKRRSPHRPHHRSPHRRGRHRDPLLVRERKPPVGAFLIAATGCTFVAYVFNFGNLATFLNGTLGSLDQTAHTYDSFVATWFVRLLPVFGVLIVLALILILMPAGSGKKKRKVLEPVAARAVVEKPVPVREAAPGQSHSFIRPVRLPVAATPLVKEAVVEAMPMHQAPVPAKVDRSHSFIRPVRLPAASMQGKPESITVQAEPR